MDSTASDTASADGVIVSGHGKIAVWAGQGGPLLKGQAPSCLLFLAISLTYLNGIPGLIKHLPLDRDERLRHCRLHEPCWFIHPQNWNTVYISSVTAPQQQTYTLSNGAAVLCHASARPRTHLVHWWTNRPDMSKLRGKCPKVVDLSGLSSNKADHLKRISVR